MKKRNVILIICAVALCVLIAVGAFVYAKWLAPTLTLSVNGGDACVEVFSEYHDDGAQAFYGGLFGSKPVEVSQENDIDLNKVGTYTVKYTSRYKDVMLHASRTVQVVDTQSPVIDAPDEVTFFASHEMPPIDYSALDQYDGDLSDAVTVERLENELVLRVLDSSGNSAQRRVTLHLVPDAEPPVLTLTGDEECMVRKDEGFCDPGFYAFDNADGDLTGQVLVEGTVNTAYAGSYPISYTVTDRAGNVATAKRTVIVYPHLTVSTATASLNGATVYLTFDDGPCSLTPQVLDILAEYEVKATFFVTGQFPDYLDLIGRAYREGHAIGVHTLTHDFAIYSSPADYFADLGAMEEIVKEQTGSYTDIIRFPGGSSNLVSRQYCDGIMSRLVTMVEEQGYTYHDWNVGSNDTGTTDPAVIMQNVVGGIQGKSASVVLMHDIKWATVQALPDILDWCLENGYSFGVLSADSPVMHHGVQN